MVKSGYVNVNVSKRDLEEELNRTLTSLQNGSEQQCEWVGV